MKVGLEGRQARLQARCRAPGPTCGYEGDAEVLEQKTGVGNTALGSGRPAGGHHGSEGEGFPPQVTEDRGPRNSIKGGDEWWVDCRGGFSRR